MKKTNQLILLLLSWIILSGNLTAQKTIFEDYGQVIETMNDLQNVSFAVEFNLYSEINLSQPDHQMDMLIWMGEDQLYTKYDVFEVYQDEDLYIMVNHETKEVSLQEDMDLMRLEQFNVSAFEGIIEQLGLVPKVLSQSIELQYKVQFTAKDKGQTRIEFDYDKRNHRLSRTLMILDLAGAGLMGQPNDQRKMEAFYKDYQDEVKKPPVDLSLKIKRKKGKWVGLDDLANYRIVVN